MIDARCDRARFRGSPLSLLHRARRGVVRFYLAMIAVACLIAPTSVIALSSESWVNGFVRFVEWPAATRDNTLVVCQPPDTPELDLAGKQVRGITLLVMRIARPRDVSRCNLFVAWPPPGKATVDWQPWIAAIGDSAVLSVGLGERFCEIGGAVCVNTDDTTGRASYRVNLDVLARAGFKVNAQLLRKQFPRSPKAD